MVAHVFVNNAEYLAGGAPPPAHPPLHVAPPAVPGGDAGAASDASAPLAAALSVASTSSSLGLDLPPAEAPEPMTYAQLYGGASGFDVYGSLRSLLSSAGTRTSDTLSRVLRLLVPRCLIVIGIS